MPSAARSPVVGIPSTLIFHSPSSPRPGGRESWNPGSGLPWEPGSLGTDDRIAVWDLSEGGILQRMLPHTTQPTPRNTPRGFGGMDVELGGLLQVSASRGYPYCSFSRRLVQTVQTALATGSDSLSMPT